MVVDALYSWSVDYVDLSAYTGLSGATCVVPVPKRLTGWNLPMRPFQTNLWFGVCALLFIEICSLLLTRHCVETIVEDRSEGGWYTDFFFGFSTVMKLLVSQPSSYNSRKIPLRVLLLACYLIDFIVTSVYSGGLATIQTVPTFGKTADTLERLMESDLQWTASSELWLLSIKDNAEMANLISRFKVMNAEEERDLAKTADMGFVIERTQHGHFGNVDYLTHEAMDHLKLMFDDIYTQYTVAFLQRCWALEQRFNDFMVLWQSSGLNVFWEWKSVAKFLDQNIQGIIESSMYRKIGGEPVEMDLENFAGIMLIWLMGTITSISVFAMEVLFFRCKFSLQRS